MFFQESPVEGQQLHCSPVLCVDNPITAIPVPVDSDTNISWVGVCLCGHSLYCVSETDLVCVCMCLCVSVRVCVCLCVRLITLYL